VCRRRDWGADVLQAFPWSRARKRPGTTPTRRPGCDEERNMQHNRVIALIEEQLRIYRANQKTPMEAGEGAKEAQAIVELQETTRVLEREERES